MSIKPTETDRKSGDSSIFADFHIHSCFSYATSKNMTIPMISRLSDTIGLNLIGTGDILHSKWREHLREYLKMHEEGIYECKEKQRVMFIPTGEIEDEESIHHLFFLPDIETADELSLMFERRYKIDMNKYGGRPILQINAEELVEIIHEYGGIIGPAHAFTPFKAIFRSNRYSSLKECYGDQASKIDFVELGLSANSQMADQISELWNYTYITNSDSHSPNPGKMGRECNIIEVDSLNYTNVTNILKRKDLRKIIANVGLEPRLGKYHSSFCFKCRRRIRYDEEPKMTSNQNFIFFDLQVQEELIEDITSKIKRCPVCNGLLKLGVKDRINSITTTKKENRNRPNYWNIVPIPEILAEIFKIKSTNAKKVKTAYKEITSKLGSEYEILLEKPISEIKSINLSLGETIKKMRENKLEIVEGGGGIYGKLKLPPN
jgi:uncharacterized protein (TIGR00375 family)